MADAKKCDRCGVFFTNDELDRECILEVREYSEDAGGRFIKGGYITKDLCSSCCRALESFMKCEPIDIVTVKIKVDTFGTYSTGCGAKHCHEHIKE